MTFHLGKYLIFFRSIVDDQWLSSDAYDTIAETTADYKANTTRKEEDIKSPHFQKKVLDGKITSINVTSPERSLLYSKGTLYHRRKENMDRLIESIEHFTYVPKLDEALFTCSLPGSRIKLSIWRQSLSKVEQHMRFMTLHCNEIIALNHNDTQNLIVL